MSSTSIRWLAAAVLFSGLVQCGSARAGNYVVNPGHASASDAGPGSEAQPFKTLEHAVHVAKAGDTVLVMPGNYGRITLSSRGTKEGPIVFKAAAAPSQKHVDKKAVLDPVKPVAFGGDANANAVTRGFVLQGARFVRVENFEITAVGEGVGGVFLKDTEGVQIVGNFLHELNPRKGNTGGVRADTHDNKNVLVQDNTFFRCAGTNLGIMGEKWIVQGNECSHGTNINTATGENVGGEDAIRPFGKGHVIRRNYVHDFLDSEQFPKSAPHIDAFQVFSVHPDSQYAFDLVIEENYCANIGQMLMASDTGAKEDVHYVHDITLRGNVFRGAHANAIILRSGCERFTIVNNVIAESHYGAVSIAGGSRRATVVNNLFYNNGRAGGRPSAPASIDESSREGSTMDYNLSSHDWTYPPKVAEFDKHSKIGVDPKFVDANAGDYRLLKDSPAIGAGDPAIKSADGRPLDLGAFQFGKPEGDWLLRWIGKQPAGAASKPAGTPPAAAGRRSA